MSKSNKRKLNPKIGLLPTGHKIYWGQFPELKKLSMNMLDKFVSKLSKIGQVISPELVDTKEKAIGASDFFKENDIDILLIFPLGYTPGMCIAPVVKDIDVPIRLLNAHMDASYDLAKGDTAIYLYHEGVCCIPEYSGTLVSLGKKFKVRTGHFKDKRLWSEIEDDCIGSAAATEFKRLNFGVIGSTYTNMTDMPIDEQRLLRTTGKLLIRPEVEEIEEAFKRVNNDQLEDMYTQFRKFYDVDKTVTNDHMEISAQIAVAFDEVVGKKYDISAFGYYWWGEKDWVTQLRSQSALAVSRLAALGRPGVTEGDVKTAMAMKVMDLLGGGGMFLEFFSMDFVEDFILMGHDGPSNINVARGRPRLQHLEVHHGKTGHGLGIDFEMKKGPITLLNLTEFGAGNTFKLICTRGEVIPGDILNIGNPNCRVRVQKPIHEFIDDWCQQGPEHHIALGVGDHIQKLESFAEGMGLEFSFI